MKRDVVIALFDAEEPPYFLGESMGSTRFYKEQMLPEGVHAAIIMDLVGHDVSVPIPGADKMRPGISDLICLTGSESHPALADLVAAAGLRATGPDRDAQQQHRRHERPPRLPHPRRPVPLPLVREVGTLSPAERHARQAELREDGADLPPARRPDDKTGRRSSARCVAAGGGPVECDTVELELRLFREAFGPLIPMLLDRLGLARLETRDDLNNLALALQWLT